MQHRGAGRIIGIVNPIEFGTSAHSKAMLRPFFLIACSPWSGAAAHHLCFASGSMRSAAGQSSCGFADPARRERDGCELTSGGPDFEERKRRLCARSRRAESESRSRPLYASLRLITISARSSGRSRPLSGPPTIIGRTASSRAAYAAILARPILPRRRICRPRRPAFRRYGHAAVRDEHR